MFSKPDSTASKADVRMATPFLNDDRRRYLEAIATSCNPRLDLTKPARNANVREAVCSLASKPPGFVVRIPAIPAYETVIGVAIATTGEDTVD